MPEFTKSEIEENIKLWLSALESGNYKQGKNVLRDIKDNYCCLGVACEVLKDKYNIAVETEYASHYKYDGRNTAVLPDKIKDALGFTYAAGGYGVDGHSLADDNDFGSKTFNEIAAIVRSQPNGLFKERYEI